MKVNSVLYMPDGNHRYAKDRHLSLEEAYYLGGKKLELLSEFFLVRGRANALIFHALSKYTHNRKDKTLVAIYRTIVRLFGEWADSSFFSKNGINVHVVDHSGKLSETLGIAGDRLTAKNKDEFRKDVHILLGYSLSEDMDAALLHKPNDYPELRRWLLFSDIDLVIRTMEMRASGGPIYAMAQAQMMILDKTNPEVTTEDLDCLWKNYCRLAEHRINARISVK